MNKRMRQYVSIFAAVAIYYIVHEGAHLLTAFYYGVFKGINFMGFGMQIDVYADKMTDSQMGVFCLAGALATLLFGWILVLLFPEVVARVVFGVIGVIHGIIIWQYLLPEYTKAF